MIVLLRMLLEGSLFSTYGVCCRAPRKRLAAAFRSQFIKLTQLGVLILWTPRFCGLLETMATKRPRQDAHTESDRKSVRLIKQPNAPRVSLCETRNAFDSMRWSQSWRAEVRIGHIQRGLDFVFRVRKHVYRIISLLDPCNSFPKPIQTSCYSATMSFNVFSTWLPCVT